MKKTILVFVIFLSSIPVLAQKIDTLKVGYEFPNFSKLQPNTVQELLIMEINGKTQLTRVKTKTIAFKTVNGKSYLQFNHTWMEPKAKNASSFRYLCELKTLKPFTHIRNTPSKGQEAFIFHETAIKSIATDTNYANRDFHLDLSEQVYNSEIDLETFSLLPIKKGYKVAMPFYHPGGKAPTFYLLEVKKKTNLRMPDGTKVRCWLLYTDYGGKQPSYFWYTKKGHQFLKMEASYGPMKIKKLRLIQ
ncbi:MAG: hypothetical protein ACPGJS_02825 [Flammeovirgaceae bacterium]